MQSWIVSYSFSYKMLVSVFSAPEPKAQVHYCDHALSVVRRPSVCLSVRPSSVVNFSHFQLLLWNRWTEFKETWQESRSQRPLPILCFSGRSEKQDGRPGLWLAEAFPTSPLKPMKGIQRNLTGSKISTSSTKFVFFGPIKNKMAALASDWLRHFGLLLWNHWTEFNETWQEARSQRPLPSLCFSGRSEKQDGRPGLWLAETFSTSSLKPLNGIQRNLPGSKISTSSTKFVFFGPIGKTRWPPWPLIGWDIFDFSSETAERNSTKLDRQENLNILYQVCVFRADRKNKMAALASDWLRHFSTSSLKPLNGIQRNLTGSKISTSFTKFVFFRLMSKQKFPSWLICQKGGTLYSGARYVALWASCLTIWELIIRAPPSKMREPYSNHFVCPSVCPSVRLSVCLSVRPSVCPHFLVTR